MDNEQIEQIGTVPNDMDEQPTELKGFLKSIASARRQLSHYGKDHPNGQEALAGFKASLDKLLDEHSQITCVFMATGVVLNDCFYAPSPDSVDMFERLRQRGVMAITFIRGSSQEESNRFLEFLNIDPRDVMTDECASVYLRRRGVTTIVVTEAVYVVEDNDENQNKDVQDAPSGEPVIEKIENTDRAMSAIIEWLANQDENKEEPKVPITEILSNPELSAKLIREAVTKLHASRRQSTAGEVATEVIDGLKQLASNDAGEWDNNTSQVRKAIAKLPEEMRPAFGGFSSYKSAKHTISDTPDERIVDVNDIEFLVNQALTKVSSESPSEALISSLDVERLFDASADGMLSAWKKDLQADSFIRCSGRTYGTLMIWETSAAEHARIAHGLANLIPRALEIDDIDAAFDLVEYLCGEIIRDDGATWRSSNASSAFQELESGILKSLLESAFRKEDNRLIAIASQLVEAIPSVAMELADVLNKSGMGRFRESLQKGLVSCGRSAIPILGSILKDGSPIGKEAALQCLAAIGDTSAFNEIIASLDKNNTSLIIKTLDLIPSMKSHDRAEWCIKFASNRSADIRYAVLVALSRIGGPDAIAHLRKIAVRGGSGKTHRDEQVMAIATLGRIDDLDIVPELERLSRRRPLFGRSRYETVRNASIQASDAIRKKHTEPDRLAA